MFFCLEPNLFHGRGNREGRHNISEEITYDKVKDGLPVLGSTTAR